MVKTQPSVLQLSEKNLESTVKLLHDRLGVTKESLKKMILSYPSILCYSASNLNVKVDFFEEVGMKREKILENPQLMTLSVEGDLWEEEVRESSCANVIKNSNTNTARRNFNPCRAEEVRSSEERSDELGMRQFRELRY